jgi:mRNA interferase RelE/StbE
MGASEARSRRRYEVKVECRVAKFLSSLKDRKLLQRFRSAIDSLESDPRPKGSRKLKGAEQDFRIRIGDYRILYRVEDDRLLVVVIRIRHRRGVYRD